MKFRRWIATGAVAIATVGALNTLPASAGRPYNPADQSLRNLGLPCGGDADALDDRTRAGLRAFQELCGLPVTGELDDDTQSALLARHDQADGNGAVA